jgi:hypothetical protein
MTAVLALNALISSWPTCVRVLGLSSACSCRGKDGRRRVCDPRRARCALIPPSCLSTCRPSSSRIADNILRVGVNYKFDPNELWVDH